MSEIWRGLVDVEVAFCMERVVSFISHIELNFSHNYAVGSLES